MSEAGKGYEFLSLMRGAFDPKEAENLDVVIEFEFTDLEETHHFDIEDRECKLKEGSSEDFTTKIITTYENWEKVSAGEVEGPEALLEGLYKIKGDFELMQRIDDLFPTDEEEDKKDEWDKDSPLVGSGAMTFSFIPWIISWIFIQSDYFLGIFIPLLFSLAFVCFKKFKNLETTYFEKANLFYFIILDILGLLYFEFLQSFGLQINYIAIAIIWGLSVPFKSLTMDYSKYNYSPQIMENAIFVRTNDILTVFWTAIFLVMGAAVPLLESYGLLIFSPALYVLIILGLLFTNYFSDKYPEYIAKGRKSSVLKPWKEEK